MSPFQESLLEILAQPEPEKKKSWRPRKREPGEKRAPVSEESRRKMSESKKGVKRKPFSWEHRQRMSEAAKEKWAKKKQGAEE